MRDWGHQSQHDWLILPQAVILGALMLFGLAPTMFRCLAERIVAP